MSFSVLGPRDILPSIPRPVVEVPAPPVAPALVEEAALHVFSDEKEFIVAKDLADAKDLLTFLLYRPEAIESFIQRDDAKLFTYFDGNESITKTFGAWAIEKGRGSFCSANY